MSIEVNSYSNNYGSEYNGSKDIKQQHENEEENIFEINNNDAELINESYNNNRYDNHRKRRKPPGYDDNPPPPPPPPPSHPKDKHRGRIVIRIGGVEVILNNNKINSTDNEN